MVAHDGTWWLSLRCLGHGGSWLGWFKRRKEKVRRDRRQETERRERV